VLSLGLLIETAVNLIIFHLILFGQLTLARMVYLRRSFSRRHPMVMAVSAFWSCLIAAILSQVIVIGFGLVTPDPDAPLILDWFLVEASFLCVILFCVVSLTDHRKLVAELLSSQGQLLATREAGIRALATERNEVISRTREIMEETLSQISSEYPEAAMTALRQAIDGVIRPLSHQLASTPTHFQAVAPQMVPRPSVRRLLREVVKRPLIRPVPMAVVATAVSLRYTIVGTQGGLINGLPQDNSLEDASALSVGPATVSVIEDRLIQTVVILVATYLAVWLCSRVAVGLATRYEDRQSSRQRWMSTLFAVVGITFSVQLLLYFTYYLPGMPSATFPSLGRCLSLLAVLLLVLLSTALIRTVGAQGKLTRLDLAKTNEDLAREVTTRSQALWVQRQWLAHSLHGPIQATIYAGILRLDGAVREGCLTDELIASLRDSIVGVMLELEDPFNRLPDVEFQLGLVRDTWTGVCDIVVEFDDNTIRCLSKDPVCAEAVVRLASEACANAAIHGGATRALVQFRAPDSRTLTVTVRDDGKVRVNEDQSTGRGLGSRLLNEICFDWSLSHEDEGSLLVAKLAITERSIS